MALRLLPIALAAAALAVPAGSAAAADCPGADTAVGAQSAAQARDAVLCIVNAERSARGLTAVSRDSRLETAAQAHTDDMVARSYFAHDDPDGGDPGDRITAAGYAWNAYGENIAAGFATPRTVMTGWMASTGHCHNVLDPGFSELGVGVAPLAATLSRAVGTWTQDFGRARGTAAPGTDTAPRDGCPYVGLVGLGSVTTSAPAAGSSSAPAPAPSSGPPTLPGPTGTATAPATVAAPQVLRHGRRLTIRGHVRHARHHRVWVRVRHHHRTVARAAAHVRHGRYQLRLWLPPHVRHVSVLVTRRHR